MTGGAAGLGVSWPLGPQPPRTVRVLQVLGGLDRAGIESWLYGVLKRSASAGVTFDFAVYGGRDYALQPAVEALGARVFELGHPSNPLAYAMGLRRVLRDYGPYDVVHSHLDEMSGFVLTITRLAGVPVRIANSHTARPIGATGARKYAYPVMRWLIKTNATQRIGCGVDAARQVFGYGAPYSPNSQVIHCGIDLSAFSGNSDGRALRNEFGIGSDTFVVGHVGRFVLQKNHHFLIDISAEIIRRVPNTVILLVGTGELEDEVRARVRRQGLAENFRFVGTRSDIADLMSSVMDVFLLPSLFEGLPVVLVEAQAAGLPSVVSDAVTREADVIPDLVTHVRLGRSAGEWADEVVRLRHHGRERNGAELIAGTDFGLDLSAQRLLELYGVQHQAAVTVRLADGALTVRRT